MKLIYIVEEFPEAIDSVWDNVVDAEKRLEELNAKTGGDFGSVTAYVLNQKDGYHA